MDRDDVFDDLIARDASALANAVEKKFSVFRAKVEGEELDEKADQEVEDEADALDEGVERAAGDGPPLVLARHAGAKVVVVDMGVDNEFEPAEGLEVRKIGRGTRNMAAGPAMTRDEAERAVLAGAQTCRQGDRLAAIGTRHDWRGLVQGAGSS